MLITNKAVYSPEVTMLDLMTVSEIGIANHESSKESQQPSVLCHCMCYTAVKLKAVMYGSTRYKLQGDHVHSGGNKVAFETKLIQKFIGHRIPEERSFRCEQMEVQIVWCTKLPADPQQKLRHNSDK
eukprot:scaffold261481_cov20-Prasinocladus_malaysianus.AAC.1